MGGEVVGKQCMALCCCCQRADLESLIRGKQVHTGNRVKGVEAAMHANSKN